MGDSYSLGVVTAVRQEKAISRRNDGISAPSYWPGRAGIHFSESMGGGPLEYMSEEELVLVTLCPPHSVQLALTDCSDSWGGGGECMRSSCVDSAQQVLTAAPPLLP